LYTGSYFGSASPGVLGEANLKTSWHHKNGSAVTPNADSILGLLSYGSGYNYMYRIAGGNSGGVQWDALQISAANWDFAGWNVLQSWVKGNTVTPYTGSSTVALSCCNANACLAARRDNHTLFGAGDNPYFDDVKIPGHVSGFYETGANLDLRFDDYYLATGPNSAKRFVLTDASTFAASREAYICPSTSWADGSVTALLPYLKTGSVLSGKYLHYFDADNQPTLMGQFT
jgi:hypothetical protein